ncbi:Importin subunit beta-1 [Leucoagaricus sp. SymC.cos]|nr:Importin subunit beta-1 [Leucoagaricus sp. SymC.cos]
MAVQGSIVPAVIPFIEAHAKAEDWHFREAVAMTFGSIMDGPDPSVLSPLVDQAFPLLIFVMNDTNTHIEDTSAWAIDHIFNSCCREFLLDAQNPCRANEDGKESWSGSLSPFYQGIMDALMRIIESGSNDSNYHTTAYQAIFAYFGQATTNVLPVVSTPVRTREQIVGIDDWKDLINSLVNVAMVCDVHFVVRLLERNIKFKTNHIMTINELLKVSGKAPVIAEGVCPSLPNQEGLAPNHCPPNFAPTATKPDTFDCKLALRINDALRHTERRLVFNVDGLRRLAAQSVNRNADDVVDLKKLAEGGFNRTFLITMRDGFQMVARIPYPATVPKYFAVASEVATMTFLRSSGLPLPQVYGYSPESDNVAETEYIFMEFLRGTKLANIWFDLKEEIISVSRQLVELESKMMTIAFPAGGSLYYTQDLEKSPDSNLRVVGLFDWQHTSILPLFLLAGIPGRFQNYGDPISEFMTPPLLPESLDGLDEAAQSREKELYRRRLVHYHYVKNTEECNAPHYAALTDPIGVLRRRLFSHASDLWEGETLALKVALIQATKNWKALTGGDMPCPVVFDAEDVCRTMELEKVQREADETLEGIQKVIGFGPDGWVPTEHYEEAMAHSEQLKESALAAAESDKVRAEIAAHWPWDDMDEKDYM